MNRADPIFKEEKLKLAKICNGDQNLPIRISLYTSASLYASNTYKELLNSDVFYVDRSI